MKIGDLAKKTGCKVVTIRYYEKEGLLADPERSEANYRIYSEKDLERLEFIMHCRRHDMKLDEIKKLLAFRDHPQQDCAWVSELIAAHIENVDRQMESLKHLKQHLVRMRRSCSGGHSGDTCPIMHMLEHVENCCPSCCAKGQRPKAMPIKTE